MNTILQHKIQERIAHYQFNSGLNFRNLPESIRDEFEAEATRVFCARKKTLYSQGDAVRGVYALVRGKIKIWQMNHDGNAQILFIYTDGEIFGHRPLLSNLSHPVSATALEDSELLFLEREKFMELMGSSAAMLDAVMHNIGSEFSILVNRINLFATCSIRERLALFLLLLNETFKRPGQQAEESGITINRNDLAGYTGTSLENLVRTLRVFKDSGYIAVQGKTIFIRDFEALYSMSTS